MYIDWAHNSHLWSALIYEMKRNETKEAGPSAALRAAMMAARRKMRATDVSVSCTTPAALAALAPSEEATPAPAPAVDRSHRGRHPWCARQPSRHSRGLGGAPPESRAAPLVATQCVPVAAQQQPQSSGARLAVGRTGAADALPTSSLSSAAVAAEGGGDSS